MDSLEAIRQFYAKFAVMHAGLKNENLIAAFSSIERERFLSKGPWSIVTGVGYIPTPSDDPRFLYCDCAGAREEAAAVSLDKVLQSWPMTGTKSLHRATQPDISACCVGNGWWLSTAEPA